MKQARKRVLINGRFLTQRVTGVQRVAINMLLALDTIIGEEEGFYEVELVTPNQDGTDIPLKNIKLKKTGGFKGHIWEQFDLVRYAGSDLLINFCNTAPLFKRNQFVFIHDAAVFRFPEAYQRIFVIWYKIIGFFVSRRAKKLFTVSHFSRSELIHFLKAKPGKVFVASPGIEFNNKEQSSAILSKLGVSSQQYLLTVGSHDPRKNLDGLIAAYNRLGLKDISLVVVGGANQGVFRKMQLDSSGNIKVTGYVTDAELTMLYANAIAFVYPTFYEGFGLPPLEAMLCGCPVISSSLGSLSEVCGDAALLFDPHQPGAIENAIQQFLNDPSMRGKLIAAGLTQVKKYSYVKSAGDLWDHITTEIEN